jgi:hypothetical protein
MKIQSVLVGTASIVVIASGFVYLLGVHNANIDAKLRSEYNSCANEGVASELKRAGFAVSAQQHLVDCLFDKGWSEEMITVNTGIKFKQ